MANDRSTLSTPKRPTGEVFDGRFMIGDLYSIEGHCLVWEVKDLQATVTEKQNAFEARFYTFAGLRKDYAKYRRRSMRRLSLRKTHETEWNEMNVIIYKKDEASETAGDDTDDDSTEKQETTDIPTDATKSSIRLLRGRLRTRCLLMGAACLLILSNFQFTINVAGIVAIVLMTSIIVSIAVLTAAETLESSFEAGID